MVKAWRELVSIPTYEVGKPEKNPMFLEKRVYQGSSGVVYPYPVIESIADEPTPHEWQAIWLENEYIKVMVLPELGGRIQIAYDKIKQRHFIYYNHVIKPALVGLTGPWISGGIEFNWPQHHRPSTYMEVDSTIVENEDGSVTVWVNEMERMFHQKGMAGFTLRPGCAYLEIQGRVSNRTPLPQTFLWWANPAVEVNDAYQSVFPPDVNAVFDHGKRAVSSFPIATGTYYKMDYSAGVDISNYRNIPVPTSYMAVNSKYDFEGGYENDTHGGMLHVASHHYSPGKKQWTWGNGDFGRAWDRNLTDMCPTPLPLPKGRGTDTPKVENTSEKSNHAPSSQGGDGSGSLFRPYIELMAGVYTENQPDFSWLMPYEEKQFTQYFMPYREVGIVKQATKDFIMSLNPAPSPTGEGSSNSIIFKVLATSQQHVRIVLYSVSGEEYYNKEMTLSPEEVLEQTVDVKGTKMEDLLFTIQKSNQFPLFGRGTGGETFTWQAEPDEIRPIPDAAEAALPPQDTKTNDQLYLTGLHLEQYRHATWSALDYYEEALRRDPNDVRCLNQTGLWYLRRGRFDKAENYLRKAVKIWQKRNPNPYDGEAIFNLALALKYQHRHNEAYELFWKSTWNKAWADAGYFEAACISTSQGRYDDALDELNRSLIFNHCNHKARALKAAVLRLLQTSKQMGGLQMGSSKELKERLTLIKESLQLDHFNYGILYEQYLLTKDEDVLNEMKRMMHKAANNYDELALDYAQAGLQDEAHAIWEIAISEGATTPMTYYYLGRYDEAERADSYCCFPNRLEDIPVLNAAKNCQLSKAPYYLGCLYYDKRQYDVAVENWELSAKLNPRFPIVWRNLALACFNKNLPPSSSEQRGSKAVEYMERAFHLDENDERMLMELDQLYKRLHKPHAERLAFLQQYPQLIQRRDDLVLEEITLLNQLGRYEEAMQKLDAHQFHPWEGGEGKVSAQYQICRVELAKELLKANPQSAEAKRLLEECLVFPHHLGEGKLYGAQDNDFLYFLSRYEEGTQGPTEPAAAMYYNDAKPDKIFYAGLCYRALGQEAKARSLFHKLINYGKQHLFDHVTMDYFAVSLPDLLIWDGDLDQQNRIHCLYMLALGYYGMNDTKHAEQYLKEAEALDNNHQGIGQLRSLMTFLQQS
jgi:tetratricopeptide (TPR) repeat protein